MHCSAQLLLLLDHTDGFLGVGNLRGEQSRPVTQRTSSWRSGASKADALHVVAGQETLSEAGVAQACLQHRAEDRAAVAVAGDGQTVPRLPGSSALLVNQG
jgi:hypothetical protein